MRVFPDDESSGGSRVERAQYLALLSGEVRYREVYGPWGETAPSGYYLELSQPVHLGKRRYMEVYLGNVSTLRPGRRTFFGHLIERSEPRLVSKVRYLELAWPPSTRR